MVGVAVIVFMHLMWVCGLQLIIFCFFGCASFFTLGWVCIKGLFVCWRVVGCLGQHCVLFVECFDRLLVVVVGVVCENCIVDASICTHDAALLLCCVCCDFFFMCLFCCVL